jgi:hypothetical protein
VAGNLTRQSAGSRKSFSDHDPAINTRLLRAQFEKRIRQANTSFDRQQREKLFNQAARYLNRALELERLPRRLD